MIVFYKPIRTNIYSGNKEPAHVRAFGFEEAHFTVAWEPCPALEL
jgi:hypothetical protein